MPDAPIGPTLWRAIALKALDRYLREKCGAKALARNELDGYQERAATHGWRLIDPNPNIPTFDVLVEGDFPFGLPKVALPGGPAALESPHIEKDGVLCVLPGHATISTQDPAGVTEYLLEMARALVEEFRNGDHCDDFRAEFLSYWEIAANSAATPFFSLMQPHGPSRRVTVWHGQTRSVCADNRSLLEHWLNNWGAKGKRKGFTFQEALLVWLPQPMVPSEYPQTGADIRSLIRAHTPEVESDLEEILSGDPLGLDIFIGARTPHGACFAALTLHPPKEKDIKRGFRSGHMPKKFLAKRYLGGAKVTRRNVKRADHDWVHGRDQDSRQARLKSLSVLVLGCGAVGSGVARLLAQSGIGKLTLIDDQLLDWPNTSRHVLGAPGVTRNKASALADALQRDFPHLVAIEGRAIKFGLSTTSVLEEIPSFDLLISATGEWSVDALLNDLQRSRIGIPPIVYAWLEGHGTAAHALHIPKGEKMGCLRCGFTECGVPSMPVTTWPSGNELLQEPACGSVFSPFGPAELTWAQALVAELSVSVLLAKVKKAVCRTWIGRKETVEAIGGQWNQEWLESVGDPADGGLIVQRDWPVSPNCAICSARVKS